MMLRTDLPWLTFIALGAMAWCPCPTPAKQQNNLGLLPTPQHSKPIESVFEIKESTPIILSSRVSARDELTAQLLRHRIAQITGIPLPIVRGSAQRGIRLLIADTPEGTAALSQHWRQMPFHPTPTAKGWEAGYQYQQEYYIHVSSREAVVVANASPGLFHGAMSLAQLTTPDELIIGAEVMDWPEMRFRGVHLRLGGPPGSEVVRPTCGQIKYVIQMMARFKLNYLLLEPGDGAELPSLPGGWRLEALTVAQQREIRQFASAFGVEIVPVLGSWSEAAHWLDRPTTRGLLKRERLDLTRPEAIELLTQVAVDLDRQLNTSPFIHLGGRGTCDNLRSYSDFHARLIRAVRQKTGKRPLLWAMAHSTPAEVLSVLPADVVLMPDHPTNPRGGYYAEGGRFTDVWASGLAAGRCQIGVGALNPGATWGQGVFGQWRRGERDLAMWADAVYTLGRDEGAYGMIASVPQAGSGVIEAILPQICRLAELSWNDAQSGDLPDERFDRAVGWHLCGVANQGERVLRVCRALGDVTDTGDGEMASGRAEHVVPAMSTLRDIQFGPWERPIGDAIMGVVTSIVRSSEEGLSVALDNRQDPQTIGRDRDIVRFPVAITEGGKSGIVGRAIPFDATVFRDGAGGRSTQVTWDFGDGARSTETRTQHVYGAPGTYLASLTTTDSTGTTRCEPLLVNVVSRTDGVADGGSVEQSLVRSVP